MPRKKSSDRSKKKYDPEQIKRISKYESIMEKAGRLLAADDRDAAADAELNSLMAQLAEYYGSSEWKQDFAADEAGLLPKDLRRGVLSEDGIYNLLESCKESENEKSP